MCQGPSEKKVRTRRRSRHIRAYSLRVTCAYGTHICTCELTIERTRFSVSHRRLFPHVVLRHGAPFSVLLLGSFRLNPHRCPSHIHDFSTLTHFFPHFSRYSLSSSSNERPLHKHDHVLFYGFHA